jgi:hypothetical protein
VRKSDLLRALQFEIQKHNLSTFMDEKDKIVITGCTFCRKHFGTVEQFKRHITEDVLPPLLDKLSVQSKCRAAPETLKVSSRTHLQRNHQCQSGDSRAQQY